MQKPLYVLLQDTGIRARFSYGYYQAQPSEEATNFDSIATLRKSITDSKQNLLSLGFAPREVSVYKMYRRD